MPTRSSIEEMKAQNDVEGLFSLLHDGGVYEARDAAAALKELGDSRIVDRIIQVLINDPDNNAKENAADALGIMGDLRAFEPLIQTMQSSSAFLRVSCAFALGKLGDIRAAEPLYKAFSSSEFDPFNSERACYAAALGELGDIRAIEPLKEALDHGNYSMRDSIVKHLPTMGKTGVRLLIHALKNSNAIVRMDSARALGEMGDSEAFEPLVEALLSGPDKYVKKNAAEALGILGDDRAVSKLDEAYLADPDAEVRAAALEALDRFRHTHYEREQRKRERVKLGLPEE